MELTSNGMSLLLHRLETVGGCASRPRDGPLDDHHLPVVGMSALAAIRQTDADFGLSETRRT